MTATLGTIDPKTYTGEEREKLYRLALQTYGGHWHRAGDRSRETRENCGACILQGYRPRGGWGEGADDGRPNYSGWLRIYIQLGLRVKPAWAEAELREARDGTEYGPGNPHYLAAILDDVANFGCPNRPRRATAARGTHAAALHRNGCPLCKAVEARFRAIWGNAAIHPSSTRTR